MPIKETQAAAGFEDLFDLDSRREQLKSQEVDDILQAVCEKDRTYQFERKKTQIETRNRTEDEHHATNAKKVEHRRQHHGVYFDCASMIFSVGAAFAGGQLTVLGGLFGVVSTAFNKTSDYKSKIADSDIVVIDHRYNRLDKLTGEHAQQIKSADTDREQVASMMDRLMQTTQRIFEMMASSGG